MLFDKNIYIERREILKKRLGSGLVIFFGNNDSPVNYPSNIYKFRQDSSFLYYFGQHREGLVGVIDIDNNDEYLIGNDIDIEDIVWFGQVDSVADLASQCGVAHHAPITFTLSNLLLNINYELNRLVQKCVAKIVKKCDI